LLHRLRNLLLSHHEVLRRRHSSARRAASFIREHPRGIVAESAESIFAMPVSRFDTEEPAFAVLAAVNALRSKRSFSRPLTKVISSEFQARLAIPFEA
jgi:hypothetical protein